MKYILFFLLLTTASFAQTKGHALLDGSGFTISQSINIDAESMSGAGTAASALFAKNFFNSNLTSNGNHTHNGQKHTYLVNRLGSWTIAAGVLDAQSIALDSLAFTVDGPGQTIIRSDDGVYLRGGTGVNPRLDLVDDKIEFDANSGFYYFLNLPTYANDAAAASGGLLQDAIYKTATGELRIKL